MNPAILIVEDDIDLGVCLVEILKHKKYTVHLVSSGTEAITWLKSGNKADLILSDYLMDDGDGLFLLKFVRDLGPQDPPFILMTGQSPMNAERAKALGAQDFFVKPFSIPDLLKSIKKLIDAP